MTTTTATTHSEDPIAATLTTIDSLITRFVSLSEQAAGLRVRLDDLACERRLREATASLTVEGRNEAERTARLRLALSGDGDYRTLTEFERTTRLSLARVEAQQWAARMRLVTCLTLLKLAARAGDGAEGEGEAQEAVP